MRVLCTGGSGFIGTHLMDRLLANGAELVNVDMAAPKAELHKPYWRKCNILDLDHLEKVFVEFQPSHVIHLAARTTTEGRTLEDYPDNTIGTANVLEATHLTSSVSRLIVTSSQHVRRPGSELPTNDEDYAPHGPYGESKVITEKLTRDSGLACVWIIIRPTSVWGPLHPVHSQGLWRLVKKGWYLHPKDDPVVRSFAYVGNVAWQIERMLEAPAACVDRRTFYVGDEPMRQLDWINAFARALTGRDVRQAPVRFIYLLALLGDALRPFGIVFPMNTARFFNLTTNNPVPVTPALEAFGAPPCSLRAGVAATITWLQGQAA
jgi:nucleoside-diphosphate-sugar epimerase